MDSNFYNPGIQLLNVRTANDLHPLWTHSSYSSPYWRLYWDNGPGAYVLLAGTKHELFPDKIFLIPPDTPFVGVCPGHCAQFYIHFLASPPYDGVPPGIFSFPASHELRRTLEECLDLARTDGRKIRRLTILSHNVIFAALSMFPESELHERTIDARIAAVIELLTDTAAPPNNDVLAKMSGLCRNAFVRLFKLNTGESPQGFARRKRIDEACVLLHHSDLDIKSIAEKTGFCNRYHFSKVFKDLRGVSPAEFRNIRER